MWPCSTAMLMSSWTPRDAYGGNWKKHEDRQTLTMGFVDSGI